MALEGTLRDFSLADILQLIALQSKTGLLTLKSPQDNVTLGFTDGRLCSAESSAKRMDTRLGTVLVKTGRLRPEALSKALEVQSQTLQRLGYILLKNGSCSADDLREGLEIQIRKIVYALFRWTDGDYVFDQQDHIDYDHEFVTPIMIESLLMEGARMIDEWPIVEKVVPSTQMVFQKVPLSQPVQPVQPGEREEVDETGDNTLERRAKEKKAGPIKVSAEEWAVYSLVDGRRSVADIIEQTFLSEFDACKAVYGLVSRGLIAAAKKPGREESARAPVEIPLGAELAGHLKPAALALVVVVLLGFGVSRQHQNPMNLLPVPFRRNEVVEQFEKSVSLLRLRRLTEAVDTYYLTSGKFPENMETLVDANLLAPEDLLDPIGRKYRYILQSEKYYMVGLDSEGKTDIDLLFSNNLRIGAPNPAKVVRPKSGREIIVIQ